MGSNTSEVESTRTVGAVDKTCRIIEALHRLDSAGVTDLARELNIPKGTIHAHLSTLNRNGFVVKEGDAYRLSFRFLDIGEDRKKNTLLYDVGTPIIADLATETDTRVQITVEEFELAVVIAIEQGQRAVAPPTRIGKRDYLHCIAAGKAMLAHMPRERAEEVLDRHGLPARTEKTITDREELFEEMERIRATGVAFNDEEKVPGLKAVGTAICDDDGAILGSISASGPTSGMQGERFTEDLPMKLRETADLIEVNIHAETDVSEEISY